MPALVAGSIALRNDRGRLSHAEHIMDKCGEGTGGPANCGTTECGWNPANSDYGTGEADSLLRLLSTEGAASENVCEISGQTLWRITVANVRAACDEASERTAGAQRSQSGNCRFDSPVCGKPTCVRRGCLHAPHS